MKTLFNTFFILLFLTNCNTNGQEIKTENNTETKESIFTPNNFYDSLSVATLSIVNNDIVYTPDWVNIDYPMGDVPEMTGVCSDVIIRAYRKMGIDLQQELHEDILKNPSRYPNISRADNNIDHRRVPNLARFFTQYGEVLEVTDNSDDYKPGDIVYWKLGGKTDHIGIVTHLKTEVGTPVMVHNICCGQNLDDCLFHYPIYKHFRCKK